LNKAKKYSQV